MKTTHKPTPAMSSITVRNVDPRSHEGLRMRAKRNHRSMQAELRAIIDAIGTEELRQNTEANKPSGKKESFLEFLDSIERKKADRSVVETLREIRATNP